MQDAALPPGEDSDTSSSDEAEDWSSVGSKTYDKVRTIGRGTSGVAFLARRRSDGKQLLLKDIRWEGISEEEKDNARKEARILSRLRHPNVVKWEETLEDDESLAIVTEYCDGGDLEHFLTARKDRGDPDLPEDEALRLFVQMCLAVSYLHSKNIIHRDLKAANFFLCSTGVVKVGDLGIARDDTIPPKSNHNSPRSGPPRHSDFLADPLAPGRTICGTPFYIAPEVFDSKGHSRTSDAWSLGVILHELLSGEKPFHADHFMGLVALITTAAPRPLLRADVSAETKDLLAGLLEKNGRRRLSVDRVLRSPLLAKPLLALQERLQRAIDGKSARKQSRELPPGYRAAALPGGPELQEQPQRAVDGGAADGKSARKQSREKLLLAGSRDVVAAAAVDGKSARKQSRELPPGHRAAALPGGPELQDQHAADGKTARKQPRGLAGKNGSLLGGPELQEQLPRRAAEDGAAEAPQGGARGRAGGGKMSLPVVLAGIPLVAIVKTTRSLSVGDGLRVARKQPSSPVPATARGGRVSAAGGPADQHGGCAPSGEGRSPLELRPVNGKGLDLGGRREGGSSPRGLRFRSKSAQGGEDPGTRRWLAEEPGLNEQAKACREKLRDAMAQAEEQRKQLRQEAHRHGEESRTLAGDPPPPPPQQQQAPSAAQRQQALLQQRRRTLSIPSRGLLSPSGHSPADRVTFDRHPSAQSGLSTPAYLRQDQAGVTFDRRPSVLSGLSTPGCLRQDHGAATPEITFDRHPSAHSGVSGPACLRKDEAGITPELRSLLIQGRAGCAANPMAENEPLSPVFATGRGDPTSPATKAKRLVGWKTEPIAPLRPLASPLNHAKPVLDWSSQPASSPRPLASPVRITGDCVSQQPLSSPTNNARHARDEKTPGPTSPPGGASGRAPSGAPLAVGTSKVAVWSQEARLGHEKPTRVPVRGRTSISSEEGEVAGVRQEAAGAGSWSPTVGGGVLRRCVQHPGPALPPPPEAAGTHRDDRMRVRRISSSSEEVGVAHKTHTTPPGNGCVPGEGEGQLPSSPSKPGETHKPLENGIGPSFPGAGGTLDKAGQNATGRGSVKYLETSETLPTDGHRVASRGESHFSVLLVDNDRARQAGCVIEHALCSTAAAVVDAERGPAVPPSDTGRSSPMDLASRRTESSKQVHPLGTKALLVGAERSNPMRSDANGSGKQPSTPVDLQDFYRSHRREARQNKERLRLAVLEDRAGKAGHDTESPRARPDVQCQARQPVCGNATENRSSSPTAKAAKQPPAGEAAGSRSSSVGLSQSASPLPSSPMVKARNQPVTGNAAGSRSSSIASCQSASAVVSPKVRTAKQPVGGKADSRSPSIGSSRSSSVLPASSRVKAAAHPVAGKAGSRSSSVASSQSASRSQGSPTVNVTKQRKARASRTSSIGSGRSAHPSLASPTVKAAKQPVLGTALGSRTSSIGSGRSASPVLASPTVKAAKRPVALETRASRSPSIGSGRSASPSLGSPTVKAAKESVAGTTPGSRTSSIGSGRSASPSLGSPTVKAAKRPVVRKTRASRSSSIESGRSASPSLASPTVKAAKQPVARKSRVSRKRPAPPPLASPSHPVDGKSVATRTPSAGPSRSASPLQAPTVKAANQPGDGTADANPSSQLGPLRLRSSPRLLPASPVQVSPTANQTAKQAFDGKPAGNCSSPTQSRRQWQGSPLLASPTAKAAVSASPHVRRWPGSPVLGSPGAKAPKQPVDGKTPASSCSPGKLRQSSPSPGSPTAKPANQSASGNRDSTTRPAALESTASQSTSLCLADPAKQHAGEKTGRASAGTDPASMEEYRKELRRETARNRERLLRAIREDAATLEAEPSNGQPLMPAETERGQLGSPKSGLCHGVPGTGSSAEVPAPPVLSTAGEQRQAQPTESEPARLPGISSSGEDSSTRRTQVLATEGRPLSPTESAPAPGGILLPRATSSNTAGDAAASAYGSRSPKATPQVVVSSDALLSDFVVRQVKSDAIKSEELFPGDASLRCSGSHLRSDSYLPNVTPKVAVSPSDALLVVSLGQQPSCDSFRTVNPAEISPSDALLDSPVDQQPVCESCPPSANLDNASDIGTPRETRPSTPEVSSNQLVAGTPPADVESFPCAKKQHGLTPQDVENLATTQKKDAAFLRGTRSATPEVPSVRSERPVPASATPTSPEGIGAHSGAEEQHESTPDVEQLARNRPEATPAAAGLADWKTDAGFPRGNPRIVTPEVSSARSEGPAEPAPSTPTEDQHEPAPEDAARSRPGEAVATSQQLPAAAGASIECSEVQTNARGTQRPATPEVSIAAEPASSTPTPPEGVEAHAATATRQPPTAAGTSTRGTQRPATPEVSTTAEPASSTPTPPEGAEAHAAAATRQPPTAAGTSTRDTRRVHPVGAGAGGPVRGNSGKPAPCDPPQLSAARGHSGGLSPVSRGGEKLSDHVEGHRSACLSGAIGGAGCADTRDMPGVALRVWAGRAEGTLAPPGPAGHSPLEVSPQPSGSWLGVRLRGPAAGFAAGSGSAAGSASALVCYFCLPGTTPDAVFRCATCHNLHCGSCRAGGEGQHAALHSMLAADKAKAAEEEAGTQRKFSASDRSLSSSSPLVKPQAFASFPGTDATRGKRERETERQACCTIM
ncbi:putative serine/threonine-protein kinase A [Diplonema papillatum]|nr:putative serine/threonine-protein kinase A [Diplonema papillatum]